MTALDDHDRRAIAQARELYALGTPDAIRERFSGWGDDMRSAYLEAFATARYVLRDLADLAERLGGAGDQAAEDAALGQIFGSGTDTRRLAEIRAIFAAEARQIAREEAGP